jgi:hypothetical protein
VPLSIALRSNIDGFSNDIGTATISGTDPVQFTIDLNSSAFQGIRTTIEFRLYAWNASNVNGTFSVNDFSFKGNIGCVPITADAPADVTACDSYTLPALTVGNYFTGSGGTGTQLNAGDAITSTQTLYVYAETGTTPNCADENSFTVTINPLPTPNIAGGNYSIVGQTGVTYTAEAGMSNYQWTVSSGGTITSGGGTDDNTASAITNYIPCVDMPQYPGTVSSTFKTNQYFLMNVIQGLNYTVFTCNDPAPSNQIAITIYEEGNQGAGIIAASATHSGTLCSTAENNATVTFTATFSEQIRVLINEAGTDTWVGHIYDGINFNNYLGYYTQSETFQEGFGTTGTWPGLANNDDMCFDLLSNGVIRGSARIRTFSTRYLMNSSRSGCYLFSIGGDDGNRLYVDGDLIYSDWSNHGPQIYDNVLLQLSGSSQLILEYYENGGQNVIGFYNLHRIENQLTNTTGQSVCEGETPDEITANNAFTDAPVSGNVDFTISHQWQLASNLAGPWSDISGATSQNLTPVESTTGTYYYRRAMTVAKENPGMPVGTNIPVEVSDYSDVFTLSIIPNVQITEQPVAPAPACIGSISTPLNVSATNVGAYQWYSNTINSTTDASPVTGANSSSFAPSTTTSGTTYYFCEIEPLNPTCDKLYTNIVEVVIESQPSISIIGDNQTICIGVDALPFSATINNGDNCDIQWQYSSDAITWFDIPGANSLTYTPTGITTGTFFRAITVNCSSSCQQAVSNQLVVSVVHPSPTAINTPNPETQTVLQGANVSISCDAELGSGITRYRLVLLSAYGAGWHGLQEIEGYNLAGDQISLSCTGASSATYTANPVGTSSYSALNAFDGVYNSASVSGVQWLTPQNTSNPNQNYQNYTQFNPFFSPEWIEWDATEPLSEVWIYNGRYNTGTSNTTFRDYLIWMSNDSGATWRQVAAGSMSNIQGLDNNNNKISVLPDYTWISNGSTVGSGRQLVIPGVTADGNYHAEATYGCGTLSVSANAEVIVTTGSTDPVSTPVFDLGPSSTRCQETDTISYAITVENETGVIFSLDATTENFSGNSINSLTGEVIFSSNWIGTSTITATAYGYEGPKSASHTVNTLADPTVSITGGNQSICLGDDASPYTATVTNGFGCSVQWQSSTDGHSWSDIPGADQENFTPTGLTTNTFIRAATVSCASDCDPSASNVFFIAVTHPSPAFTEAPVPQSATVVEGANISITCDANLGTGATKYRLMLLSAYGAGWHGIQEIQGYTVDGTQVSLTCTGASSATHTANPTASTAYSAINAFDGVYNSPSVSWVQWLTPERNISGYTNYQNYTQFNPFYSPEWVEWETPQPLSEIWIYNGRYNTGSSNTNFRDYSILVSHDEGATWYSVANGTMNNVCGIDGHNNKISIEPNYTWKKGASTVGSGRELILPTVAYSDAGTYNAEASYGCGTPSTSANANLTVVDPTPPQVETPVFLIGSTSERCMNNEIVTYTATAVNATGISYQADAATLSHPGNYFNILTGELEFASDWTGVTTITAYAGGEGGPLTATHTITTVLAPSISLTGSNQIICPGENANELTATIMNGVGCQIQWQSSNDAVIWNDIPGENSNSYTPSGLTSSTYFRAITINCAASCNDAISQTVFIAVNKQSPTLSLQPTPSSQNACPGDNATIEAQADLGSGAKMYRLVLLSAYGNAWHGIQEIQGYNLSGNQVSLSCTGASSATYSNDPTAPSSYSALNAFDDVYNSSSVSGVQWLTPQRNTEPNTNWQNYTNINPFYSPEWIKWEATEALAEVWIYNGRYASGASSTNFRDYRILESTDAGNTWHLVASGTMANVQGLNGDNNKISVEPGYTWFNSESTVVGSGNTLQLNNISNTDTYHVEVSYDCTPVVSDNAEIVLDLSIGGTLSGSTTVQAPTNSTLLELSGQTGSVLKWQWSENETDWTDIANTNTSYTATNLTTTTYFRVEVQNGSCTSAYSTTATIMVSDLSFTLSRVTPNNDCPELDTDKGFKPNNDGPYNAGASEIVFEITRTPAVAATWEFDYVIEDATVSSISSSPNLQSGTIENLNGAEHNVHFYILNQPGSAVNVKLKVTELRDSNGGTDNTEREIITTIAPMPGIGTFQ